jgi:hypothetical protein
MNPISITIPAGAEISNYLYPDLDVSDLTQDIVTVRLPTGYYIDVGWYPEHDPNGHFVVRVFRGTWDCQQLPRPFESRYAHEVVRAVEQLADHFSGSVVRASLSGRTDRPQEMLIQ